MTTTQTAWNVTYEYQINRWAIRFQRGAAHDYYPTYEEAEAQVKRLNAERGY